MSVLNWMKVGDMPTEDVLLKLLLYGHSGAGKTWTASTAPKPCYLLTEPNGLPTIRAANPTAIVVQADAANGGLDTVRQFLRMAKSGDLARDTGCQTIIIDSLNELQRMLRDEILAQKVGTKNEGKFTLEDWGTLTDKMRNLVRAFRDLPFHLVAITHADTENNEATRERYTIPSFQGRKLPNEIAGYFSAVGYQHRANVTEGEKTTVRHLVLLSGPDTILCKPLPGLSPVEEPNITGWLQRLAGYEHGSSAPAQVAADPTARKTGRRARATKS